MFNRNKQKSLVHFCVKKDILKVSSDVQRDIDIIEILNSAKLVIGTEEELRKQGKPQAIWDKILPDWQKSLKKWPQNAFSKWFGKSEKTNVKVQFIRKYKNIIK